MWRPSGLTATIVVAIKPDAFASVINKTPLSYRINRIISYSRTVQESGGDLDADPDTIEANMTVAAA